MDGSRPKRKAGPPRVNFPLSLSSEEARQIESAYELTGESRNGFVRIAAIARAKQVLAAAEVTNDINAIEPDRREGDGRRHDQRRGGPRHAAAVGG